jgi:outer membrane lipoprotein carrier protein
VNPFRCSLFALLLVGPWPLKASPGASAGVSPEALAPLKMMLGAQKNLKSLSADFTQTRTLRTLRSPLVIKGKLWFEAPGALRWELGDPPKMILIGNEHGITIIHPFKKEAEKKSPASASSFFDPQNLGMTRFAGEGSFEEFQKQMQVTFISTSGSRCHVEMLPKDPAVAKGIASMTLDFDTVTGRWLSFGIVTREGSSLLDEFSNVQINPRIPGEVFKYNLSGFTVTDDQE